MTDWIIREPEQGPVELWQGRKRLGAHDHVRGAERKARRLMEPDDRIYHEASDGYRTLLTKRKGWRSDT